MLRQLLVGTAVSVCNIAIHALVMATVVQISSRIAGANDTVRQSLRLTTVMIATVSIVTERLDGGTFFRGDGVVTGLYHRRCGTHRCRPSIFRFRKLHDARLRRRNSRGALATTWANNGNERRAPVWLVDSGHIRGSA